MHLDGAATIANELGLNNVNDTTSSGLRPSIFAVPFERGEDGRAMELLSVSEQDALMAVSPLVSVQRNGALYSEGEDANFIYNLVEGVAETYRLHADGEKRITAFLFPRDLLGLSANGAYVASARAITTLSAFRIPVGQLRTILKGNPALDISLVCKLCHELRSAQYHSMTVSKRDASVRLASFLLWMDQATAGPAGDVAALALPMSRHDIADYLGLSVEAVSRAFNALESKGLIKREGTRAVSLLERKKLCALTGQSCSVRIDMGN